MHRIRTTARQFFKFARKNVDTNTLSQNVPSINTTVTRPISLHTTSILSQQRDHFTRSQPSDDRLTRNFSSSTLEELRKRHHLPVVDLRDYSSQDAEKRKQFVSKLGNSLKDYGFVAVAGHNVDPKLLNKYYGSMKDVFDTPMATKKKYARPELGRNRGYYELGQEVKANKKGGEKKFADISEKWHSGAVANVFPEEAEGREFKELAPKVYKEMEKTGVQLVEAIGDYLDTQKLNDHGYLKSTMQNRNGDLIGSHLLRSIHYPPVSAEQRKRFKPGEPVIRAGEHDDLNLITLLPESVEAGLEIRPKKPGLDHWIPIHSQQGHLICNSGKMLSLISGGQINQKGDIVKQGLLPSIRHRVVGDDSTLDRPRYSTPFFVTPHYDKPLKNLQTHESLTTGEFLYRRLKGHGSLDSKVSYEEFRRNADQLLIKDETPKKTDKQ
jgi:isopenicillin N synthase-like dioxygenase